MSDPIPAPDIDDPWGIRAGGSTSASGTRVLKHGDSFAVFDRTGDILDTEGAIYGLFHEGTRFLSALRLRVGGDPLLLLSSSVSDDNVLTIDLTNGDHVSQPDDALPHGTIHVQRTRFLWNGVCYERCRIENFGLRPVDLEVRLQWSADFIDLFELRGTQRARRGQSQPTRVQKDAVVLAYRGLDGVTRTTHVALTPSPSQLDESSATYVLRLDAKAAYEIDLVVACANEDRSFGSLPSFEQAHAMARAALSIYRRASGTVRSSNARFDAWLHRSEGDVRLMVTETDRGPYPYAGIPWFSTPFGRDGIITAMLALWIKPDIAAGVLRFLAAHQATERDDARDAEPGKIVHELRRGEMAALGEIPFGKYYGSVDSTPLFVMLMGDYLRATGDLALVQSLWPASERALGWIDAWGDLDGDGFVEYGRRAQSGLVQQGWKDSHDSVFHDDGSDAPGPIALCEVQGYVYAAWRAAVQLCTALGRGDDAARYAAKAAVLRDRFDDAFWCDEIGTFALALDGRKRACRVRSSNAGQCLFTGIARPERARILADQLLGPDMFSGWGIRTLSALERRYNPLSYHNGSVWPHDNALIALGLSRYGFKHHAMRVLEGLFDASQLLDLHRTPELFCGLPRRVGEGPTLYPVACAPQAWAAAAAFGLVRSVLGLSVRADPPRVRFHRPVLPRFLEEVVLANLPVGSERVTVRLHRYPDDVGVNVTERSGPVEIVVVK